MRKLSLIVLGLLLSGALSWVSAEEAKPAAPAAASATAPAKPAAKPMKKAAKKKAGAIKKEAKAMYRCEHCNITSDKPGKCPACGMEMKKI